MSQPIIVLGDRTSHGGTVIGGSPTSDAGGKPIARVGDMVSCPKCKGVFPIAQGDNSWTEDGKAVAYHGCKTMCGATLLAGQAVTTTEPFEPTGAQRSTGLVGPALLARGMGSIDGSTAAGYEERLAAIGDRQLFQGRFRLVEAETGEPVSGRSVRVRSTGGQNFSGSTDEDGCTEWITREVADVLAFNLAEAEQ